MEWNWARGDGRLHVTSQFTGLQVFITIFSSVSIWLSGWQGRGYNECSLGHFNDVKTALKRHFKRQLFLLDLSFVLLFTVPGEILFFTKILCPDLFHLQFPLSLVPWNSIFNVKLNANRDLGRINCSEYLIIWTNNIPRSTLLQVTFKELRHLSSRSVSGRNTERQTTNIVLFHCKQSTNSASHLTQF